MIWWIVFIILGFIAVHLFKMARLYLVLMEHKIPFGRFVLLYFRTIFINLIIPYKIGELYRVEEIARETKVWQVGLLSVLVDRYFDTVALFLVLLPLDLVLNRGLSPITIVFGVIIFMAMFVYQAIPSSYAYLNRYLIRKKSSKRSMATLKGLDIVKDWYDFTKNLITGRSTLIIMASLLGWLAEVVVLRAVASWKELPFGAGDFASYIEAIFMSGDNTLLALYTGGTALAFLVLTILGYIIKLISMLRKDSV